MPYGRYFQDGISWRGRRRFMDYLSRHMGGIRSEFCIPQWARVLSLVLKMQMEDILQARGTISLMLTGGRASLVLYRVLGEVIDDDIWKRTQIFFGDERCVSDSSLDSNSYVSLKALFPSGIPFPLSVSRMWTGSDDPVSACQRYAEVLPDSIDILLLSMGDDGHIASLFPGSPVIFERSRKVMTTQSPIAPHLRLSITPPVISSAKNVFVLAIGEEKRQGFIKALYDPRNIEQFPARLVLNRTWIFESTGVDLL